MVKRIIENAGGKITLQSEEGSGTEFKVYFPSAM
jgi:signal transduction histidine kinase